MPSQIPAFAEYLREATSGGLVDQLTKGAGLSQSREDLDLIVGKLDCAIHSSLQVAGMPALQHGAQAARQRPTSRGVDAGTRELQRQKRVAVRQANWELVQRLNQEKLRLLNLRRRQDKSAQEIALVLLAKADRSAFWQKWKKRLSSEEGPIAAEEFRAYFEKLFGAGFNPGTARLAAQIDAPACQHPDNSALNQPITATEVLEGLKVLQQRKSVLGFLKLEFLTPVADVLVPGTVACARDPSGGFT